MRDILHAHVLSIERSVLTWHATSTEVVKLYLFRNITGI
jgi:hypothetical protein